MTPRQALGLHGAQGTVQLLDVRGYRELESLDSADRNLTCVQCGNEFVFSADDQRYHSERGYQDPKRCPTCRAERRSGGGGGGGYGGGRGGGGYDRPQRQMFSATCARCGKEAMVPFEPRGDKPVYCSDCYQPRTSRW